MIRRSRPATREPTRDRTLRPARPGIPGRLGLGFVFLLAAGLSACGGGANPLGNPPTVVDNGGAVGQSLSFLYFERCINPILQSPQTIDLNGTSTTNTCASAGCHNAATGRGGALRLIETTNLVTLLYAAANAPPVPSPAAIRATDMYKNFYSAQAEVLINNPAQSLLVNKPLLRNVLHGGGLIFSSVEDPNIKKFEYWIQNPMPAGQDEFSTAALNLFTGATPHEPMGGVCNSN